MGRWISLLLLASCGDREPTATDVFSQAGGCFQVVSGRGALGRDGQGYAFTDDGSSFTFQASDLGTYLLYDEGRGYVVADGSRVVRQTKLESDVTRVDDSYVSGAEWQLETSSRDGDRYQLRSRRTGGWLGEDGVVDDERDAVPVDLEPARGCAAYPELTLDATGSVQRTHWEDGDVFGVVDAHSHIFANFGFGGGLFHGSPYHRLGVEHALGDCDVVHGEMGRNDFFGYAYDGGNNGLALGSMVADIVAGELSFDNHATDGYPTFSEWPNARKRSTHQVQYHKWLERAYLSGLRLIVQHGTSNAVICKMSVGLGAAKGRYDCEDMTSIDREIDEAYALERYLDAQAGGPGKGWLRVVTSPAQAREVIGEGKLAMVLGIETSDVLRCPITRRPDGPLCDQAFVDAELDRYFARGVRALFPVHKYDNAFSPGDGSGDFIEAGNFLNSGHYTNLTEDCPGVPGFDGGPVTFGGLLEPRDDYLAPAPNDFGHLEDDPLTYAMPFVGRLLEPAIPGNWCQNATLTPLGEHLIVGMMRRGMILEVDHFPQRSYLRVFELLAEHDYPAVGTHGLDNNGQIYDTGGLAVSGFGNCHDPAAKGTSLAGYQARLASMAEHGAYPGLGFGFDLNGFAGARPPRFGPEGGCATTQENPTVYPFTSYAGDVVFTPPVAGERAFDFDTEGLVHIGLLPELIHDAQVDAVSEADLEPLFRSAEAYLRMWERAEARGAALSAR